MKKTVIGVSLLVFSALLLLAMFPVGQHADRSFDASVANPARPSRRVILFDEGHFNSHSIGGSYAPFARLMRHDGYVVRQSSEPFSAELLRGVDVLVIVNAAGGSNPKLFGFNLVPLRRGRREAPAFSATEIAAVRNWVDHGGSLLLVADHYPFGTASAVLSAAFGVTMHGGYASVPAPYALNGDVSSVRFSRGNGLLSEHPITRGRNPSENLKDVYSFTGQSLDGPAGTAILRMPRGATEDVPPPPDFKTQPAGAAQGIALECGSGRVVVLGEAAMLTAQVSDGHTFGMNVAGNDNRQCALNIMHWLSRVI